MKIALPPFKWFKLLVDDVKTIELNEMIAFGIVEFTVRLLLFVVFTGKQENNLRGGGAKFIDRESPVPK